MKKIMNTLFLMLILFVPKEIIAQGKAEQVIERFGYDEVRLTGGRLKLQLDQTVELYLNIPNKDLLKGFRERAGLPEYGAKDLGGWYSNDVFHAFGQYLSGLSRLYAATGEEACRTKLNELIDGWAETIEPDGYFYYTKKPNARHYVYEKMQAGLLDAYLFAGNESALEHMSVITDWAIKNLHPERKYPYTPGQRNVEWYTLSENLYRAYLETGEKKYRDFGMYWEYLEFWNAIRESKDIFANKVRYHAYSHLNSLSGAAMAYKVKNDKNYLNTLINGYDFFINNQAYITGGFGPIEQLVSKDDKRIVTNFTHNTFETQCGSWAGFKLSKYLLEFTGNGKYGHWIEKLLINGIGASVPMLPSGEVMYYSDYNCKQAVKSNYTNKWSCCTGTRPQAIADYVNLIYFKDDKGIYVNYFTPSTVRWNDVVLEQITEFPVESATAFTVNISRPKTFDINIRKSLWLDEMTIKVNGKIVEAAEKNGWMSISRTWQKGDKIEAAMPMGFKAERMHPEHPYPLAMAYGPVALTVINSGDEYPISVFNETHPGENLVPQPGKKLTWRDKNHPDWIISGFFQLEEEEPYVLYVDERAERVVPNERIVTTGKWNPRGYYRSAATGSTIATEVQGAGIRVVCYKGGNGGKLKVEFNGKDAGVIDLYADGERIIEFYDFRDDTLGKQSIKLIVLPEKNEKSTGTMAGVLGFEALQ